MPDDGSYGGRRTDKCFRCKKQRDAKQKNGTYLHQVPEITDSKDLRETTAVITYALEQDKELFKVPEELEKAYFMIGVMAVTIGGQEHFFATSSGWKNYKAGENWLKPAHLKNVGNKWKIHHPRKPDAAGKWRTILNYNAHISPELHAIIDPCAATRLLIQVAQSNTEQKQITNLKMCEMVFVGKDVDVTKPQLQYNARTWKGHMSDSSWTAHSCEKCMQSIPYLICSRPDNEIPD